MYLVDGTLSLGRDPGVPGAALRGPSPGGCGGSGVLCSQGTQRRPEAQRGLASLQSSLVLSPTPALSPGHRLGFSGCSQLPEGSRVGHCVASGCPLPHPSFVCLVQWVTWNAVILSCLHPRALGGTPAGQLQRDPAPTALWPEDCPVFIRTDALQ